MQRLLTKARYDAVWQRDAKADDAADVPAACGAEARPEDCVLYGHQEHGHNSGRMWRCQQKCSCAPGMSGVVLQLHYAKWRQVHAVLWHDLKANILLSTETWAQASARVKMCIEVSWLLVCLLLLPLLAWVSSHMPMTRCTLAKNGGEHQSELFMCS